MLYNIKHLFRLNNHTSINFCKTNQFFFWLWVNNPKSKNCKFQLQDSSWNVKRTIFFLIVSWNVERTFFNCELKCENNILNLQLCDPGIEADGAVPDFAVVTVHYCLFLENNQTPFDSTKLRGKTGWKQNYIS